MKCYLIIIDSPEVSAAIGLAQIERIKYFVDLRIKAEKFFKYFKKI